MYKNRFEGITYGGDSSTDISTLFKLEPDLAEGTPPHGMHAYCDATWNNEIDRYGIIILYRGAAVFFETKKVIGVNSSSTENEGIAGMRCSERVRTCLDIAENLEGRAHEGPVLIGCDNSATVGIVNGIASPGRIKHILRRFKVIQQRVQKNEIKLYHVPDEDNPADFLTKWTSKAKVDASVAYLSGTRSLGSNTAEHTA